jgi:hypothetical protein
MPPIYHPPNQSQGGNPRMHVDNEYGNYHEDYGEEHDGEDPGQEQYTTHV